MATTTRPVVADLVAWLKLQSTPDGPTTALHAECMAAAIDDIESRVNLPTGATCFRESLDDGVTTLNAATISSTSMAFTAADVGRLIIDTAGKITVGTTILSVQSATAATLSAVATGTTTFNVFVINPNGYTQRIRTAILLDAARLVKRSTSPEGVAGMQDIGAVVHIMGRDPDIERLIRRFLKFGFK